MFTGSSDTTGREPGTNLTDDPAAIDSFSIRCRRKRRKNIFRFSAGDDSRMAKRNGRLRRRNPSYQGKLTALSEGNDVYHLYSEHDEHDATVYLSRKPGGTEVCLVLHDGGEKLSGTINRSSSNLQTPLLWLEDKSGRTALNLRHYSTAARTYLLAFDAPLTIFAAFAVVTIVEQRLLSPHSAASSQGRRKMLRTVS